MIDPSALAWLGRFLIDASMGRSASAQTLRGELRASCEALGQELRAPRVIRNAADEPYLSRYYLIGGPERPDEAWDASGNPRPGTRWLDLPANVYLHHLHCGDDRGRLHSHPWEAAVSLILAGGYREERRVDDRVQTRVVDPLELNVLRSTDFHRLDLVEPDAWSLFVTGKPTFVWHFWDPETLEISRARPRWAA